MNLNDKSYLLPNEEDDESGEGKGSGVRYSFQDPSAMQTRDDLLSPEEKRRLLATHEGIHKGRVTNQKHLRQARKKEQKGDLVSALYNTATTHYGKSGQVVGRSNFLEHPLASKFSGQDPQVSQNPQNYVATTNEKEQTDKKELVMRQELTHKKNYTPSVSIKPPRPM